MILSTYSSYEYFANSISTVDISYRRCSKRKVLAICKLGKEKRAFEDDDGHYSFECVSRHFSLDINSILDALKLVFVFRLCREGNNQLKPESFVFLNKTGPQIELLLI